MSGLRVVALALIVSCNVVDRQVEEGPDKVSIDPAAAPLHAKLLAAADSGDVAAFKAALTQSSVEMIDEHIQLMAKLPRPTGERPFGWDDVLRMHAALPESARQITPYPLVGEGSAARLDLTKHADARLYKEIGRSR